VNARKERLARNETLFREVNERIRDVADDQPGGEPHRYEFFCECADTECMERVAMTLGEYEVVRRTPTWFFIVPGHEFTEIEQVVRLGDGYEIVDKVRRAGELAVERDPRS
jgi:hypothetical protein